MSLVAREVPTAHLYLVGGSPQRDYHEQVLDAVRRFGITSHVTFLGYCAHVTQILETCDVGVLSSRSEGFPLALVEYAAAGLPVVSTDVGQCREILDDGRVGLLVAPQDPRALADALLRVLDGRVDRSIGDRLRARVERRYSVSAVVTSLSSLYTTLAHERNGHR
jgi:glycosyltransferase involved in cell wall biosynthesis